jgi:outer membrane protein, multidrug efflux system
MTYIQRTTRWALALTFSLSANAFAQRTSNADRGAFWAALGDTTLERLIASAVRANPSVAVANAQVGSASAARFSAALGLAPAVTAVGGYARQRLASPAFPGAIGAFPDQNIWDAGLRLSWNADVFGGVRRSVQGQGELVSAAQEDLGDLEVSIASQVATAYFDLRGAQDRLAVANRNAENQRGTLELTLNRLEAGRGTELDTDRARAQLSTTLAAIPMLEAAIAAAQHRIAVLTGRPPVGSLTLGASRVALPDSFAVANADSIVRRRHDVRSAERQLAAQSAFVSAARTDYLPRVEIGGAAGYTSSAFDALGKGGTPRYSIGPVISWPAFDLARVRAGVDVARAAESAARARYDQTVLRSLEEVETSLVTYQKARERLKHLDDAAAASERAAEIARLRYAEGASDFLQVLDAERSLLDAQDRRAAGRTDAALGLVTVYRALGGNALPQ